MASFVLSAHAKFVLAERGILAAWIEQVMSSPEKIEPDRYDSALTHAMSAIPQFGGRTLRVIYNDNVTPRRIVTAYFDRAQRKKS